LVPGIGWRSEGATGESPGTVLDLLMLILLAAAFAGGAGYVEACARLAARRSPSSDTVR
jgi:hypothetical protein